MPSDQERIDALEKRLIRAERKAYAPIRSGTVIAAHGIVYRNIPTQDNADEPTPTDVVRVEPNVFQGLIDVRLESGQVITEVPVISPTLIAKPFNNLGFDVLPGQQFYELEYRFPAVNETVIVLWDGGKIYLAMGQIRVDRNA